MRTPTVDRRPPIPTEADPPPRATDQVPDRLMAVLDAELTCSGKWASWCQEDPRLEGISSLADAVETWRRRDSRSYQVVAALTRIGSRRGGDDNDAALAVVVLLAPGIARLATALRDICEVDDVRTKVWEMVKAAEPQLGSCAARHLLRRARQQLTRPGAGRVRRKGTVSLDACLGWNGTTAPAEPGGANVRRLRDGEPTRFLAASAGWMEIVAPVAEDPASELEDLLDWARGEGVLESGDVDLLAEFVAAANDGHGIQDALRLVGARRGLSMRTIRRRRDAILARLRDAAPDYLAATA